MEQTFELTLTSAPEDGEPSPTESDIQTAVSEALSELGFDRIEVRVAAL